MADLILDEIDLHPDAVKFYCDSKVVLGCIFNDSRRFFVYVHNRVRPIRQTTRPEQWHYVPTDQNPVDFATRSVSASQLANTSWFTGPAFLHKPPECSLEVRESFQLIDPELDVEICPRHKSHYSNNARPLVPISSDPDSPFLLTPAMLLTQRSDVPAPPSHFTGEDLFKSQWRQVQTLANEFWVRWRREYLPTLQSRRKWNEIRRDLQTGDIVLLKDSQLSRNKWPMGLVTSVFPSSDGKVRKIEVRAASHGTSKSYMRPVSEVILLLPERQGS
ncbi:uncharacterized protein LOC129705648 [Leucoraja erinacea]|uniref:uncharacterized protein LOC129705648 n=1 Tax=Leucoraja erinaceus TaxID=7782 RepID=UPI002458E84B|nr:uncharacterized protein LOC129705648 [Leucoraja erinacea]